MMKNYDEEVLEIFHNLDDKHKQEALVYLRSLQRPKGVSGKVLAASMQGTYLDEVDATEMIQLIEDACE